MHAWLAAVRLAHTHPLHLRYLQQQEPPLRPSRPLPPSNQPPPPLPAAGCDAVCVQVPGGWVPDDRVIVGDNLQSSVICLLSYSICPYRAGPSALRVCCGLDWFHGRRIVTCSCLLAGVVAVYVCCLMLLSLRCILCVTHPAMLAPACTGCTLRKHGPQARRLSWCLRHQRFSTFICLSTRNDVCIQKLKCTNSAVQQTGNRWPHSKLTASDCRQRRPSTPGVRK